MVSTAAGQQAPPKPPAVGVVAAVRKPVTQSSEYVGRIQAIERVNLIARVAAFLDARLFTEGAEVKKDQPLIGSSRTVPADVKRRRRRSPA
jgi:membrane fusion protein (multidrug efflux system)